MPIPKLTGQISVNNYYASNGSNENLTLLQAGLKPCKNLNVTFGVGNDLNISADGKSENKPAIELKCKYNIGEHLNAQARFREIGGKEQYRLTFGSSYGFDRHHSVYAAVHATTNDFRKGKTGGWVGYTYATNSGISLSAEVQQNFAINNKTAKNTFETLGSFDDGNKLFNVMISIPIK